MKKKDEIDKKSRDLFLNMKFIGFSPKVLFLAR